MNDESYHYIALKRYVFKQSKKHFNKKIGLLHRSQKIKSRENEALVEYIKEK